MQVKELIHQSWDALTRNRLRSVLTMMGIVWGLTTVVLLLGYGQSVSAGVLNAFLGIGNNVIMVWEGQTSMQAGGQRAGKRIHFKYDDVEAIREEAPLVRLVSARMGRQLWLQVRRPRGHGVDQSGAVSLRRNAQAEYCRGPLLRGERLHRAPPRSYCGAKCVEESIWQSRPRRRVRDHQRRKLGSNRPAPPEDSRFVQQRPRQRELFHALRKHGRH